MKNLTWLIKEFAGVDGEINVYEAESTLDAIDSVINWVTIPYILDAGGMFYARAGKNTIAIRTAGAWRYEEDTERLYFSIALESKDYGTIKTVESDDVYKIIAFAVEAMGQVQKNYEVRYSRA